MELAWQDRTSSRQLGEEPSSAKIIKEYMDSAILAHQGFYKRGVCNFSYASDTCTHSSGKPSNSTKRMHDLSPDGSSWPVPPRPLKRQRLTKDPTRSEEAESSIQGETNSEVGDWDCIEATATKLQGTTQSSFKDHSYGLNSLQRDCNLEDTMGQAVDHCSGFDQLIQGSLGGETFIPDDLFDISAMPSSFWGGSSY